MARARMLNQRGSSTTRSRMREIGRRWTKNDGFASEEYARLRVFGAIFAFSIPILPLILYLASIAGTRSSYSI